MRILAVDDDPFILEVLKLTAARADFTDVTTVLSGDVALRMISQSDVVFDCLLLDIGMPGMDGIELCAIIRKIPSYEKTPIIMLTAMAEKDPIDRAFQAGATDYANKPFSIVGLHARLLNAQKLVAANLAEVSGDLNPIELESDDMRNHFFDVMDTLDIENFKELITFSALNNYLVQLSTFGVAATQVVAIKIDQIKAIYARSSSAEFSYVLNETAEAISCAFIENSFMMAYAGNGTFVVICNSAVLEPSIRLEILIQNAINGKGSEYDNGARLMLDISIGNPIRPGMGRTQKETFDWAIARTEDRATNKRLETRLVKFN